MDRMTATAAASPPSTPAELARLEAFFRGFGVTEAGELDRLAGLVRAEAARAGERSLMAAAVRRTAAWLGDALQLDGIVPEVLVRLGRAAFVAADAGRLWPQALLAAAPEAMVEALHRDLPIATPPVAPLAMPAQALRPEARPAITAPARAFGRATRMPPLRTGMASGARAA